MYWPSTSQVGTSPTSLGSPPWRGMAVWLAAVEVVLCLGSDTVWLWLVPSQADYVWGALQASCVWLLPWPACPAVDWPRGKSSRINPRLVQVDRLRYSLVAIGLMYTSAVSPCPTGLV